MGKKARDEAERFERAAQKKHKYVLTLYIANMNAKTRFAIENIKKICDEHLQGRYTLEVIDIRENPSLAAREDVVATPMLIKKLPPPLRTFIGNMNDVERILVGLKIKQKMG